MKMYAQNVDRTLRMFLLIRGKMYTVWSVNDGLSGNLWRFPEVSRQSIIDGPHGMYRNNISKIY